jgi:hypothetical protein
MARKDEDDTAHKVPDLNLCVHKDALTDLHIRYHTWVIFRGVKPI